METGRRATERVGRQEPAKAGRDRQTIRLAEKKRLRRRGGRRGVFRGSTCRTRLPEKISSTDQGGGLTKRGPSGRSGDVGGSNIDSRRQETDLRHSGPSQSEDTADGVISDR